MSELIPINTNEDKSRTLMAGYYKYGTATLITNKGFKKGGATAVTELINIDEIKGAKGRENYFQYDLNGRGNDSQDQRVQYPNSKMHTLTAGGGGR